jgi:hypothetical protein
MLLQAPAQDQGSYAMMYKYYHNNFSANKQNRDVQTHEQGGFAAVHSKS